MEDKDKMEQEKVRPQISPNDMEDRAKAFAKAMKSGFGKVDQKSSLEKFLRVGGAVGAVIVPFAIAEHASAQEVQSAEVTGLPDADLTDTEIASVDLNAENPTMTPEANSELSRLMVNLQPKLEATLAQSGPESVSMQVVFIPTEGASADFSRAKGTALPFIEVNQEGVLVDGLNLRPGSIVFQTGEENGSPTFGYLEPVDVEGYGGTRPVLMPVTSALRSYMERDLGLDAPSVGDWVGMTVIERDGELVPVSIAGEDANGNPVGLIISFGVDQEAPATPEPRLAKSSGGASVEEPVPGHYNVDPTGEVEAERKWDDMLIQAGHARTGLPEGDLELGTYHDPDGQVYVAVRIERAYRGGHFENDGDVWYAETRMGDRTLTLIIGQESWLYPAKRVNSGAGGQPTISGEGLSGFVPVLEVVEYFQQNPGIPVMLEYTHDTEGDREAFRNTTGDLADEAQAILRYMDLTEQDAFLAAARAGQQLPGDYLMWTGTWIPGFFQQR